MERLFEMDFWVKTMGFSCGGEHVQPWRLSHGASSIKGRRSETS
jgi:hypothetical protein